MIIDGGSSDGTLDVIDEFAESFAYCESGLDSGISDAFNRGIREATGEYIAILNSDDYWCKDFVALVSKALHTAPDAHIYYGRAVFFDPVTGLRHTNTPRLELMPVRMSLFHPATIVRRDVFERIGLYSLDYEYAMDAEWFIRALVNNLTFQEIDHELAVIQLGGKSDQCFKSSLLEYRDAVLLHKVAGRLAANYYFWKYYLLKSLTKYAFVRRVKNWILDSQ